MIAKLQPPLPTGVGCPASDTLPMYRSSQHALGSWCVFQTTLPSIHPLDWSTGKIIRPLQAVYHQFQISSLSIYNPCIFFLRRINTVLFPCCTKRPGTKSVHREDSTLPPSPEAESPRSLQGVMSLNEACSLLLHIKASQDLQIWG